MDPVTVVVAALVAGAAAGASNVASAAVTDAYEGLKNLVLGRLRDAGTNEAEGNTLVVDVAKTQLQRDVLTTALAKVGVDAPTLQAAQHLLALLEPREGKYVVDASQAKGVIIGDHGTQHNTFN